MHSVPVWQQMLLQTSLEDDVFHRTLINDVGGRGVTGVLFVVAHSHWANHHNNNHLHAVASLSGQKSFSEKWKAACQQLWMRGSCQLLQLHNKSPGPPALS